MKPILSNKVVSNEKVTLIEDNNIVENDKKTATVFNNFFSNIIKNLGIPQYNEIDPYPYSYPYPIILTLKTYQSVVLNIKQIIYIPLVII